MPRHIVLLRGINVGAHNRLSMPELGSLLADAGFEGVQTYVQSGNIVLSKQASAKRVAEQVNLLIKQRFGINVIALVRSPTQLAEVVRRNPLAGIATDPKRYLVTFLSAELDDVIVNRMRAVAGPHEQFAVIGREVYSWHPAAVGRSPLWERLAAKTLGRSATSRNWTTVSALLAMAAA